MLAPEDLDKLLVGVAGLGLLQDPKHRIDTTAGKAISGQLAGTIHFGDQTATLVMVLPQSFPLSPPAIYLDPWDALGFIPHVLPAKPGSRGTVCYASTEGMILDRRQPEGICAWALERAISVLA